jgi:prepilin-type N-terminal cleavage/methylation domain-containing protein
MANRRGFTLAEILIAMTLMLIVGGAAFKLLVSTQRLSRSQA